MELAKKHVVRVINDPGVLRVQLTRGDRYNAIDSSVLVALAEILSEPCDRVLVLEGEGAMFSVGPDIAELVTLDRESALAFSQLAHQVSDLIEQWPGVTVAHLNGYALGCGLELALACDVLVATPEVRIGLPGLAWALFPCMGGLRRLACRVSTNTCSDLFLNGEVLSSETALEMGLIDRIVSEAYELDLLCREMAEYDREAVRAIRDLRLSKQGPIDAANEANFFAQAFANGECQRRLRELLAN
jgi:enoyl-CoA hydratase